jgi:uncharacterized membrane protein
MLITVPIGAWVSRLVFDIATRIDDDGSRALTDASYWLIAIGLIGAVLAAIFGAMDLSRIPRRSRAFGVGLTHMGLNILVVALFVANFIWRSDDYDEASRVDGGQLALSAVAIAILGASGWLGGKLTYRYGVRVADENTQNEGLRNRPKGTT